MGWPAERVPFVGLTGGLGAGKSTALKVAAELGAATLSTDTVVHELLATPTVRDLVVDRLGSEVVEDGEIDRGAVARKVFESPDDRDWLERMLWPRVGRRLSEWRTWVEATDDPPAVAVVETPLLFEAGMEDFYDFTIAVIADEELRAERAGGRGHQAVTERSGRQLSQEEKSHRATFTIRNNGTLDELRAELSTILATIGADSQD